MLLKGMWLSRDGPWLVPGFVGGLVVTFAAREAEESYRVSALETGSSQQSLTLTHSLPAGSIRISLFILHNLISYYSILQVKKTEVQGGLLTTPRDDVIPV